MKVRVRRSYLGKEGKTHKGQVLDISEQRFRELTEGIHSRNPLVDPLEVGFKMQTQIKNKMEAVPLNKRRVIDLSGVSIGYEEVASVAAADPTPSPPPGGRTGVETDASLSAPARQRRTRGSKAPEAEPDVLSSTTRGSSPRGQTFSTVATSRGGKNTRASSRSKG